MLAGLGMFVFETSSALFTELARSRSWRHARTDRFGARAASQYLGPGEDKITITGSLVPGLAGKYSSLDQLATMADTGDALQLSDGTGTIYGHFVIEQIDDTRRELIDDGRARIIDFTITLGRVK